MGAHFQKISKSYDSLLEIAKKYYLIVFSLNNINVTPNQLELVAFSAINGTLSTPPVRDEFIRKYNIPIHSVYNMIAELKKQNILIKDKDKKIRVNPQILPDFTNNQHVLVINLQINA